MVNRTGTYFAFDGLGETNPSKSDFRYYATIQAWDASKASAFRMVNSHDKASSVRDSSKLATLKASIRQRLAASKNVVVICSSDTRKSGSLLSWEIEEAVDSYKLPLIIAYTRYESILQPYTHASKWPTSLEQRINDGTAKAIHIPFKQKALFSAIDLFSINGEQPNGSMVHYSKKAQTDWGYL